MFYCESDADGGARGEDLTPAPTMLNWRHRVTMNVSLKDSLVIRQEVVFRELGDEAVLLNLRTGSYFGFDPVGTRIWQLIVEHGSLARVLESMLEEYEVEPGMLERDL